MLELLKPHLLRRSQDPHRYGQVIGRPLFTQIGRRQVNGDALISGEGQSAVLYGCKHAVATFPHGRIRQANQGKGWLPTPDIDFDVDHGCFQADDGRAEHLGQHGIPSPA